MRLIMDVAPEWIMESQAARTFEEVEVPRPYQLGDKEDREGPSVEVEGRDSSASP
jgi:hypothetical protein